MAFLFGDSPCLQGYQQRLEKSFAGMSVDELIKNGDHEAAFKQIIHDYSDALVGFAYRFGFSGGDAEEIAQETLVHAWKNIKKYQPKGKLASWLFRIETNICLDRKRAISRRPSVSLEGEIAASETPEVSLKASLSLDGPEEHLSRKELVGALRRALEALPERQRAALLLARYEKMSYEDIAKTLNVSVGSVKQLISRARLGLAGLISGISLAD